MNKKTFSKITALVALSVLVSSLAPTIALASSHREAPNITADPIADGTDVYAFVSPDKPDSVTLIANYIPFQEPAGGPNFYRFGDDVLYEIKVDNTADAKEDITYQFRFNTRTNNGNTFLYNTGPINSITDPNWNVYQTYTVTRVRNGRSEVIGQNLRTPPSYVGTKSTPNYEALAKQATYDLPGGIKVFAGQRDDPFFVDLGLFDLINVRRLPGNNGGGVDQLKGYNVSSLAIQVPIAELGTITGGNTILDKRFPPVPRKTDIIGVWSTASRQSNRVIRDFDGISRPTPDRGFGNWVTVSRLGAPLVNEVVLPLDEKDIWNNSKPTDDKRFLTYVQNSELAGLLKALFGVKVPPSPRDDLVSVFLTGVAGLNKPENVVPSEQLRLNMSIKPTKSPNALGVLAGDNQGFPNGRRLADDVTDIEIKAVAGAVYPLFHPGFVPDPLASQLGDGVDKNDVNFQSTFPYLATPHNGFTSVPHATSASSLSQAPAQNNSFFSMIKDFLNNIF